MPFLSNLFSVFNLGKEPSVTRGSSESSDSTSSETPRRLDEQTITLCSRCGAKFDVQESFYTPLTSEKLRAGYVPSELEAAQIPYVVQHLREDLDRYDEEIAGLQEALDELKEKRAEVKRHLVEQRGLLAPIRKLPVEVLAIIFNFYCSSTYALSINVTHPSRVILPATLDLAQTCSRWRKIVMSQPVLWSSLYIDLDIPRRIYSLIHLYLRKSAHVPLNLHIEALELDKYPTGPEKYELVQKLRPDAWAILLRLMQEGYRWQKVCFILTCDIFKDTSGPGFELWSSSLSRCGPFPRLESLVLRSEGDNDPSDDDCSSFYENIIQNAPNLRYLNVDHLHRPLFLTFSYHHFTRLELVGTTEQLKFRVPNILKMLPYIQTLNISLGRHVPDLLSTLSWGYLTERWRSSTLKTLTLEFDDIEPIVYLFNRLILPSLSCLRLESVKMRYDNNERAELTEGLLSLLTRSSNSLTELTVIGGMFTTKQLVRVFALTPRLEYLHFSAGSETRPHGFFKHLTLPASYFANSNRKLSASPKQIILLPRLKRLSLHIIELPIPKQHHLPNNPKVILRMVESRRRKTNSSFGGGSVRHAPPLSWVKKESLEPESISDSGDSDSDSGSDADLSLPCKLEEFSLFVSASHPIYRNGEDWIRKFHLTTEPGLKTLARSGLKLGLTLEYNTV